MFGLLFLTVGFVVIAGGNMPTEIAILWTSISLLPVIVGCCLCYCVNGEKCTNALSRSRSRSINLKTVSIGTMTAQQPSTPTQMSPQVQLRVILLFHNLWPGHVA